MTSLSTGLLFAHNRTLVPLFRKSITSGSIPRMTSTPELSIKIAAHLNEFDKVLQFYIILEVNYVLTCEVHFYYQGALPNGQNHRQARVLDQQVSRHH